MIASIVVGTDGSETAGKAVREAGELAAQVGASMEIVSAYEPVGRQRLREEARQVPDDMQWMGSQREDVDATLRDAAQQLKDMGVKKVTVHAREGDPADAILDVAEEQGSDLIVV